MRITVGGSRCTARGPRYADKRRHYEMAAGSAAEVTVALRIAVAKRYLSAAEVAALEATLDRVRAMLWRLTHHRR